LCRRLFEARFMAELGCRGRLKRLGPVTAGVARRGLEMNLDS
jgi:hypothetical protein